MMRRVRRCAWARDPLNIRHHDEEWGVACHDDRRLFEMLILEGAQAGLSWSTILAKRENYRRVVSASAPPVPGERARSWAIVPGFSSASSFACGTSALSGSSSKVPDADGDQLLGSVVRPPSASGMCASTEGVPQASRLGIAPIVLLPFVRAALRQAKASSSSTCALHLIESTRARIVRGER